MAGQESLNTPKKKKEKKKHRCKLHSSLSGGLALGVDPPGMDKLGGVFLSLPPATALVPHPVNLTAAGTQGYGFFFFFLSLLVFPIFLRRELPVCLHTHRVALSSNKVVISFCATLYLYSTRRNPSTDHMARGHSPKSESSHLPGEM